MEEKEVIVVSTVGEDDFRDLGEAKPAFNNLKYDHFPNDHQG